jgi:hypothetical protein
MAFRNTSGIFTNASNPTDDADVIMTAVLLGFTAEHFIKDQRVRFDMDPADFAALDRVEKTSEQAKRTPRDEIIQKWNDFCMVSQRIETAVNDYVKDFKEQDDRQQKVLADLAPDYGRGAVIMGVYRLADQTAPVTITDPVLSFEGKILYNKIVNKDNPENKFQYIGRGAYTGFVDNKNGSFDPKTKENISDKPVGPLSTARFRTPENVKGMHPRWLPPIESSLWKSRLRYNEDAKNLNSYVPWGLIGGGEATKQAKSFFPIRLEQVGLR